MGIGPQPGAAFKAEVVAVVRGIVVLKADEDAQYLKPGHKYVFVATPLPDGNPVGFGGDTG